MTPNKDKTTKPPKGDKSSYFLIFYMARKNNSNLYGNIALGYASGFPNRDETCSHINEKNGTSDCIITSLIKISKSDYDEWCRK